MKAAVAATKELTHICQKAAFAFALIILVTKQTPTLSSHQIKKEAKPIDFASSDKTTNLRNYGRHSAGRYFGRIVVPTAGVQSQSTVPEALASLIAAPPILGANTNKFAAAN